MSISECSLLTSNNKWPSPIKIVQTVLSDCCYVNPNCTFCSILRKHDHCRHWLGFLSTSRYRQIDCSTLKRSKMQRYNLNFGVKRRVVWFEITKWRAPSVKRLTRRCCQIYHLYQVHLKNAVVLRYDCQRHIISIEERWVFNNYTSRKFSVSIDSALYQSSWVYKIPKDNWNMIL